MAINADVIDAGIVANPSFDIDRPGERPSLHGCRYKIEGGASTSFAGYFGNHNSRYPAAGSNSLCRKQDAVKQDLSSFLFNCTLIFQVQRPSHLIKAIWMNSMH